MSELNYSVVIKKTETGTKKTVNVYATDVHDAHKKVFTKLNELIEDIVKIYDNDNNLVFSSTKGFISQY